MHEFITGQTMSGKSTLARLKIPPYLRAGVPVAVYSPVEPANVWPEGCNVFIHWHDFLKFVLSPAMSNGGLLVVDEADTVLAQGDRRNWWVGTRSRHYGFKSLIITQRPTLVAPTVRGQCAECYAFNLSAEDAKQLARDYNAPGLLDAPKMKQGGFLRAYWKDGEKVVDRGRAW